MSNYDPANDQRKAELLVGERIDKAWFSAVCSGFIPFIASRDGQSFIRTMEFNPRRVNLTIEQGIVKKAEIG